MSFELPDDAEIGYRRPRLPPLIGLGAAMTLLSAVVGFARLPFGGVDSSHGLIGAAGMVMFGLAAAIGAIRTLFTARAPVVLVSRYGIRDLRVANEFILWDLVTDVSACEYRGRKFVVLQITPMLEQRLFRAGAAKAMLAANRAAGLDGIVIRTNRLDTNVGALLAMCRANYAAAKGAERPLQRGATVATQAQWALA